MLPDSPSPDDKTSFAPPPSRAASSGPGWTPPSVEHLQALLPQYEIISMLGHGGMGAVYKGKQKSLDRLVAIKILPPGLDDDDVKFSERFKNEARTMAKLMHPGIVAVFDFGEIDGSHLAPRDERELPQTHDAQAVRESTLSAEHSAPLAEREGYRTAPSLLYFVMEYVDGTDVAKMIQSSVKLPPDHALAITAHVCDALAYAHANGVIHRDIKPANILINMQGQVKVADFGLAKIDDPAQGKGLTMTGMTMGTPDFVAPEALVMGVNVDGRADLYAIGVMLYQMLTGEIPRGLFQMPGELTHGEIDPRFDAIIAKAMQTNREARYQSASAIRKDLDVILTTPRIKQDASQAFAAVPQGAVRNVPGQRSIALKPGAARTPRKDVAPAAKPPSKSKTGPIIGIAATLVVAGGLVFMMSGKKGGEVTEPVQRVETPPAKPAQLIKVVEPPKTAESTGSSTVTWTDGLDEWLATPGSAAKDTLTPESGAYRMAESGCTLMLGHELPMRSLANVAVRVKLRHAGAEAIDIHLREQSEAGNFYSATFTKTGATRIISRASMISADLAAFEPPAGFDPAASHALEFRAEGEQLSVSLDGKFLGSASDTRFSTGQFSVTGKGALIESVEYRGLGKTSAPIGKTIELLPLVDLAKDTIVGPWSSKAGDLFADRTQKDSDEVYGIAWCALPYTPPEEFDVDAEFTSHESSQATIMLPLVGAKTHVECTFFYGGEKDRWHSLERLDDTVPYDPKRNGEAAFKVKEMDFSGRHRAHIEVRRSSIKVTLDGATVVDWSGDLKRFAISQEYPMAKRLNRVVIGRGGRPMTFHRVSVREVSGSGVLLDGKRPAIPAWIDGLAEWWQSVPAKVAASILTKEAGGSRVNVSPVRKAIFLSNESKRAVLTAKATVRDISDYCALYVRHQSPDNYQAVLQKDGTTKIMLTKANGRELARSAPIPGFDPAKSHVFEFKADFGQFIIRLDGKETCRASDDTIRNPGTFYFTGDNGTLIEKLEYR